MLSLRHLLLLSALVVGTFCPAQAEDAELLLRLKDGSFIRGQLTAADQPDRLRWQNSAFETPLDWDIQAIRSLSHLPGNEPAQTPPVVGSIQLVELLGGGVLAGRLTAMDPQWLTVDSELLGTLQIERRRVRSLVDAGFWGQVVYSGPVDDDRWQRLGAADEWQFEGGTLTATKPGATIVGNVDLPSRSQINLVLSWRGTPDFVMSFGTLASNKVSKIEEVPAAARLEVWDKQLALVRESDSGADIALLSELAAANPRIELNLYLDQVAGTVVVCDSHGRPLETLRVPATRPITRPAVHLANYSPGLSIEKFEVREWDGVAETLSDRSQQSVLNTRGENIDGVIVGFDVSQRELVIRHHNGSADARLPLAELRRGDIAEATGVGTSAEQSSTPPVVQPPQLDPESQAGDQAQATDAAQEPVSESSPTETAETPAGESSTRESDMQIEVVFTDRSRLSGRWLASTQDGRLQLASQDLRDALAFPTSAVLGILGTQTRYQGDADQPKSGTLKMQGLQLGGYLEEDSPPNSTTGLYWHPHGSLNASQLTTSASGAIIYRQQLPKLDVVQPVPNRRLPRNHYLEEKALSAQVEKATKLGQEILFRSGDAIAASVERIDERGVSFASAQTDTKFASHDQLDHIWLNRNRGEMTTTPEKLQRLLTVPRSMKQDPPTHLFIAVNGDYLRGRLVRLEKETLTVEIRLELVDIPVSQVAEIIWLHDRNWSNDKSGSSAAPVQGTDKPAETTTPEALDAPFQVHAIATGDRGLTFEPTRVEAGVLRGRSPLLGDCAVNVDEINQLLFGRDIIDQVRAFRDDPWTLSLAQYPRVFLEESGEAGSSPGMLSPLVGKPAPEFGLNTLDGKKFQLNQQRDRILVLDFWASWCGPCMQTMPLVDEIVAELGSDRIQLVAVNIQETAARAQLAVERLELAATVLLDVDGQVAAAYAAQAIPQTVIIDRDGNITHLFVGGGPKFVAEFRAALESLLSE